MAANKILNIQPQAIGTSVANILNCAITALTGPVGMTATQPYLIVKHVRLFNNTGAAITVNLYKGATGGSATNTETFFPLATSVPANSYLDWYGQLRLDSGDFVSGNASATGTSIQFDTEIGFS